MSSSRSLLLIAVLALGGLLAWYLYGFSPTSVAGPLVTPGGAGPGELQVEADAGQEEKLAREAAGEKSSRSEVADPEAIWRAALSGFRGRLVDRAGRPLPGTPLRLFRVDPEILQVQDFFAVAESEEHEPLQLQIHEGQTDGQGLFEILGTWPQAMHLLEADPQGTRRTTQLIDRSPGPGEIVDLGDIVLDDLGVIIGRVIDEDGEPIPGAMVRALDLPVEILQMAPFDRIEPDGAMFGRFADEPMVMVMPPFVKRYFDMIMKPRTTTDGDGRFRLVGVQPGLNTLICNKRGFSPKLQGHILVKPQREKDVRSVRMDFGGTARVRVVDGEQEPVSGAEVLLAGKSSMAPVDFGWRAGQTDAAGKLQADGVPGTEMMVAVRRSREQPWVVRGPVSVDRPLDVVLPSRRHLDVTLKSAGKQELGKPEFRLMHNQQEGVPLDAAVMGFIPWINVSKRVQKVEDGSYRIPDLVPGNYSLAVRAPGHAAARVEVQIAASTKVELTLPVQQVFEVLVQTRAELPVAGAKVYLQLPRPDGEERVFNMPLMVGRTDSGGRLRVDQSSAGRIRLSASHPAYGKSHAQATLPAAEPIVLQMDDPGEIIGTVTENGAVPTPGKWTVVVEPRRTRGSVPGAMPNLPRFGVPDLEGRLHLKGLSPGQYRLQVVPALSVLRSPGGFAGFVMKMESRSRSGRSTVEVESGKVSLVDLEAVPAPENHTGPTVRLSGSVLLNGQPRAGLLVQIRGKHRDAVNTDKAGRFDFGQVPVDTYHLRMTDPQQVMISQGPRSQLFARSVELKAGADEHLELVLQSGGMQGQVFRADGRPAASLRLVAEAADEKGGVSRTYALADPEGRFVFDEVTPGKYRIKALGRDQGFGHLDTEVGAGVMRRGLRIDLQSTHRVEGRIQLPADEKPEAMSGWMRVTDEKGATVSSTRVRSQGEFRLSGMPPGSYKATVYLRSRGKRSSSRFENVAPLVVGNADSKELVLPLKKVPMNGGR